MGKDHCVNPAQRKKIIAALHQSRMRPYLDAALQNEKNAIALYLWHTELTAAMQAALGVTEVILRNAVDRELQSWNASAESVIEQTWPSKGSSGQRTRGMR